MSTDAWADREIAVHLSRSPWCATRCGAGPFTLRDRVRSEAAPEHHFFEVDFADGDPANTAMGNLQILCVRCHKTKKVREEKIRAHTIAVLTATVFAAQSSPDTPSASSAATGVFRALPVDKFREAAGNRSDYLLTGLRVPPLAETS